jgi:hypothetical protein
MQRRLNDAGAYASQTAPQLVLHVSDLHICVHETQAKNRHRREDLQLFTAALLPRLGVSGVLLTGDLTHAKSADGRAQLQYDWEWQTYANITRAMREAAGSRCQVRSCIKRI